VPSAENAYLFKHVLLRDAAYQLQLPRQRAKLHSHALEIMERQFAGGLDLVALELADHAKVARELSGDRHSAKALARKEAGYLARAALGARLRFDNLRALEMHLRLIGLPDLDRALRLEALTAAAELQQQLGRPAEALNLADQALAVARATSARSHEARCLLSVAHAHRQSGRLNEAQTVAGEALRIYEALSDAAGTSRSLSTLGNIEFQRGNVPKAVGYLSRSMDIERGRGNDASLGAAYLRIGATAIVQNRLEDAENCMAQAELLANRAGDKPTLAAMTGNRGVLMRRKNNYPEALKQYLAAEALNREMGALEGLMQNLGNRGSLHRLMGDLESARACHAEAEALARRTGNQGAVATNVGNRAMLEYMLDNYALALELCTECEGILKKIGDKAHLSPILHRRGLILRAMGRTYEALQAFILAREADREQEDATYIVTHLSMEAEALVTLGALDAAETTAGQALEAAKGEARLAGDEYPIMALSVLVRVAHARGNASEVARLRIELIGQRQKMPMLDAQLRKEFDFIMAQMPAEIAPTIEGRG
jgi:tetratricopeptide (TPR) repeat protein